MTLFSTLLKKSSTATSSSSTIPTLLELHPVHKSLFSSPNNNNLLSYQALEVNAAPEDENAQTSLFSRRSKQQAIVQPNLGIWTCSVDMADALLPTLSERLSHVCLTIDLSQPAERVETQVSQLHQALVRFLIQRSDDSDQNAQTEDTTTPEDGTSAKSSASLAKLTQSQFGLAPQDTSKSTTTTTATSSTAPIHLLLCVTLPDSETDDYRLQQARNLLLYHLRKYAAEINAGLVMVGDSATTEEEQDEAVVKPASLTHVPHVILQWVSGAELPPSVIATTSPEELEILQRHAQHADWNVLSDSLWKALPMTTETLANDAKGTQMEAGDENWLAQLRDSVATATATTVETTTPAATTTTNKTEDKAVASFFEDLLKK